MEKLFQVAVLGPSGADEYACEKPASAIFEVAERMGEEIGRIGAVLINGGLTGAMEAASRGCASVGGLTIAVFSGTARVNQFSRIHMPSGDFAFRESNQLILMSDAVVSIAGGAGTLNELCVAYRLRKPTILLTGFGGWTDRLSVIDWLDERKLLKFIVTHSVGEAVEHLVNLRRQQPSYS